MSQLGLNTALSRTRAETKAQTAMVTAKSERSEAYTAREIWWNSGKIGYTNSKYSSTTSTTVA